MNLLSNSSMLLVFTSAAFEIFIKHTGSGPSQGLLVCTQPLYVDCVQEVVISDLFLICDIKQLWFKNFFYFYFQCRFMIYLDSIFVHNFCIFWHNFLNKQLQWNIFHFLSWVCDSNLVWCHGYTSMRVNYTYCTFLWQIIFIKFSSQKFKGHQVLMARRWPHWIFRSKGQRSPKVNLKPMKSNLKDCYYRQITCTK